MNILISLFEYSHYKRKRMEVIMNFRADVIKIRDFFVNKKYEIPRYQREYSWTSTQLNDFYSDIVSNIKLDTDGNYKTSEYFFGTVILVGDMSKYDKSIEIIDGQQRITTITIFLSVLSNILYKYDSNLSNYVWKYLITNDANGDPYTVLENHTASPYFQNRVQKRDIGINNNEKDDNIIVDNKEIDLLEKNLSSEAQLIKKAYDFFKEKLEADKLYNNDFGCSNLDKVEKLKLIRDQLLDSSFIYIISENIDDVNAIFENINSKGLHLSALDLIKNEIFSGEKTNVPVDDAKQIWSEIKENLRNNGEYISIQKFYRYFWMSRYKNCGEKTLYKDFKQTIPKEEYMNFLKDLRNASNLYSQIINPRDDYFRSSKTGNNVSKDDLAYFTRSLKNLQNTLGIEQVQVLLLSLVCKYEDGLLSFKNMRSVVKLLENYHFVYNGILTERTNKLVGIYGKAARDIYKSKDKIKISKTIDELKKNLIESLPKDKEKFKNKLSNLSYTSRINNLSKNKEKKNVLAKYVVYKLEEILSGSEKVYCDNEITIEHIIPASSNTKDKNELNIGNLIVLEKKLNEECGNKTIEEKIDIYKKSQCFSVKKFLSQYGNGSSFSIENRAEDIADDIYDNIISKQN